MNTFTLDRNYVKEATDKVLDSLLDKEIHKIEYTEFYVAVEFVGDESLHPNGNGYVISYGGILAEIDIIENEYGKYSSQEEYNKAIAGILERTLETIYGFTVPALVAIGI